MKRKFEFMVILTAILSLTAVTSADSVLKTLYIDGVLIGDANTTTGALSNPSDNILIGDEGSRWYMYNKYVGKIDEFAIYAGVMDSTAVAEHYAAGTDYTTYESAVSGSNPLLWLKFDDPSLLNGAAAENSGSVEIDGEYIVKGTGAVINSLTGFVPDSDAVELNSTATAEGDGTCINVSDSDGYFSTEPDGDVSIELWFNCTSTADYPRLFQHNDSWQSTDGYGLTLSGPNSITVLGGGEASFITIPSDINDGQWHYLVVTYDSTYEVNDINTLSYAEEVNADNPVVWIRFDSEDDVLDETGNNWVTYGSLGHVVSGAGYAGNSFLFDVNEGASGAFAAAVCKNPAGPSSVYGNQWAFAPNDITIEFWYKTLPDGQAQPNTYGMLFQQIGPWTNEPQAPAVGNSSGTVRIFGGSGVDYTVSGHFNGQWHHYVVTYDEDYDDVPDNMKADLYIDGEWKAEALFTDAGSFLGPELDHMVFGAENSYDYSYNVMPGYWDEIAVYDGILSADRIAIHYAAWQPAEVNTTGTISLGTRYQEIEGFGAAGAWYEGWLTDHPESETLYDLLFDELGLDIYRVRNTYEFDFDYMSRTQTIVTEALERNPDLKILISSWSPPAYLKSNGDTAGGGNATLAKLSGTYVYSDFADWWADSITAWSGYGVDADYISIQNEVDYDATWDSCRFSPTQTLKIAGYNQAFEAVYQELYSQMGPNMPKMLAPETVSYTGAGAYINALIDQSHAYGYNHHLYGPSDGDDPDGYLTGMADFADTYYGTKPIFQTEYSHNNTIFTDGMNLAILMHNALTVEGVVSYFYWDLFWADTSGLVSIPSYGISSYTINPVYYAFKHYAKFTDPGWQRVAATSDSNDIRMSAFVNPDGNQMSVILINTSAVANVTTDLSFGGYSIVDGNVYRSSETENCELVDTYSGGPILLPMYSITTLSLSILPPDVMADAGQDITAYAFYDGFADVNMDGSGSYEVNDLPLSYYWSWTIDGNDYEANGVSPTISLPIGEEIQRRRTVPCDREHTIQLIADNGSEQSQPDYCTVNVVPAIQSRLRCRPGSLSSRTRQTEIAASLNIKGIGIDDIDWDESIIFYPGAIEGEIALDRRGNEILRERGSGSRQAVTMKVLFDKALVESELDLGVNTVHVVVKANSGQWYDFAGTMKVK